MSTSGNHIVFAAASLLPVASIMAAALLAGPWPLIAVLSITLWVFVMDRIGPDASAPDSMVNWLPRTLAAAHFVSLGMTLWAVARPAHLDAGETIALVLAMGLFAGQVTNACAHELIHRPLRRDRWLGTLLYCSILNGHHVSAHLLVHHVHAGTTQDPNSAPIGRGFYRYALQATINEYAVGLRAETKRRAGRPMVSHPYVIYGICGIVALCVAFLLGGGAGLITLLIISFHAQMQLLLSDYLQHYGLSRTVDDTGKPEPMGPHHSWNAPHPYSAALMVNAPRHSDHHMHPARDFASLTIEAETMPMLPYSVPIMGAIALVPPLWRHLMDPLARKWSQDSPLGSNQHRRTRSALHPALSGKV